MYVAGEKVKVVRNTIGHHMPLGTELELANWGHGNDSPLRIIYGFEILWVVTPHFEIAKWGKSFGDHRRFPASQVELVSELCHCSMNQLLVKGCTCGGK